MVAWVKQGPAGCGLDRANWTAAALATSLYQTKGLAVSARPMRAFGTKPGICPYRPTSQDLKDDPDQQAMARQDLETFKQSPAGALVLLSQDETRFAMMPTLRTALGVTGHRPLVGHRDGHDVLDVFGALNLMTEQLTTRIVERPHMPTQSKRHYLPAAFARHVRDIVRAYPAAPCPRVVIVIDKRLLAPRGFRHGSAGGLPASRAVPAAQL